VYARSTTIPADPSAIDAGIRHIRDEVQPALEGLDGFVGLSMMADRASGMTIATSAWRDAAAMHASKTQAQMVRDRAGQILGGSPVVEEWEIAVMHRDHSTHAGACVRSAWLQTDMNRIDAAIDMFRMVALPQIEALDGFCSASFMVDRATGRAVSSACYESRAALDASRDMADRIRTAGTMEAQARVMDVLEFDLELAHLRVPEMA
jgi:quinol monooxygenase YgiN